MKKLSLCILLFSTLFISSEDISMYEDLFSGGQRIFHGVILDDAGNLIRDNQEPVSNCLEDYLLKQRN